MKISLQQLSQNLKQRLAPIYLISGDEHFLVQEAIELIRKTAIEKEFSARESFHIESGFNWQVFLSAVDNLSLLSEPTIVELKFPTAKLGDDGAKVLLNYATNPAKDKILIIIMPKLEAASQKTKWFKAMDTAAIVVQVWPIDIAQLPQWIVNRLKQYNLNADSEGIKILADYVEGNLLAAAQEIEKLSLLYSGEKKLSTEQIIAAITDNARFDMFDLVDEALAGNGKRVMRILDGLHDEGVEPVLVLWAITRELRSLIGIKKAIQQSNNFETAASSMYINFKRKNIIKNAVQKHSLQNLEKILHQAGKIDLVIKGAQSGNVWLELQKIYLALASVFTGL